MIFSMDRVEKRQSLANLRDRDTVHWGGRPIRDPEGDSPLDSDPGEAMLMG